MVQFESLGVVSYLPSIVTMALSCISFEIKRNIGRKLLFFGTPLHSAPPLRGRGRNITIPFGIEKLEWWGYPIVKKNVEDIYNRLHRIPCDGQTDRHTDILRRHSPWYAYMSRGKNTKY